jgi:hypothetical protein
VAALLCASAFGLILAGCHHTTSQTSGYGFAWITLTDEPGDFTSYLVTVDSVVLSGSLGSFTAVGVPELVDFTKLVNLSEMWASAAIPVATYDTAIITLDFTNAQIAVQDVNGAPLRVIPVDSTGAAATVVSVAVALDPTNPLTLQATFASSNAVRLAFDYDLAASNTVDLTSTPPSVTVKPYFTASTSASDSKLIRIRGPLVNSSVNTGTYSTFIRPFFDEVDNLGSVTIFNGPNTVTTTPNTIWTLGGNTYVGRPGLTALSQTSAGSTMTAAFTTFQPTMTLTPGITAGIFNSVYVVAGSTLEDFYTDGIEGDVIARNGNTLTLRGATLFSNANQAVLYVVTDSLLIVGPSTLVTADGVATLGPLNFNSVSVGQHITARGLFSQSSTGIITIDATGATSTNTGSVRLQSTEVFGSLISSASGSLVMNLQAIQDWPVSIYNFAGNGTSAAQDPTAANYIVNSGSLALPLGPGGVNPVAPGDLLWVDGFTSPFGTAPPDFIAESINAAPTVAATMIVSWTGLGTVAPFATLTGGGLTIDLSNAAFGSGEIRIGADVIPLTAATPTPQIIPQPPPPVTPGLPPVFLPLFAVGNTITSILSFNSYAEFVTTLNTTFSLGGLATKFTARGVYNPASNVFTAAAIDVVL